MNSPKWTLAWLAPRTVRPVAKSIRQWPAFICMSDMMAIGTTRAIQECGYTIPDDFSVTGYDGLGVLNYIHPGITTIDQNISSKGYIGMKMLYRRFPLI